MSEQAELEQAAIRLLAIREHSRLELQRKLQARTEQPELLQELLDRLQAEGYQSDGRFAEQYVESRKAKGFGPVRIGRELRERGVDSVLIEQWLDPHATDWSALLQSCCRRKFGNAVPGDYRERAKRARFLEYRGFPVEMIRNELWADDI
ncbi:MAG: recombination regulator RecX [Sedimenticola sp.]|nr:recombination regulator RecX [Sedimenticola sp.]